VTFAGVLSPTPFSLSGQLDVLIQVYRDLIGYIKENGQLNNMAAGPKLWRKSPDPTQRSGWGLGTRLVKSQATRASKAAYFLDHVIEPSLANSIGSFNNLLKVMEDCEYDNMKELAELITIRLIEGAENTSIGEFCVYKPGSGCHH